MKTDVYQMVTDRILAEMEKGICPWQKPWHGGLEGAISYTTGRPYSLLNQFLLGKEGEYLTFAQIKSLGGSIKKGAKSKMVVFFKQYPIKVEEVNKDGEKESKVKNIPLLRYYNVFHLSDTEGIKSKIKEKPKSKLSPVKSAEKVVNTYYKRETCKLNIKLSGEAYYSPCSDEVVVPQLDQYDNAEQYYSTLFHETTHSTGAKSRLDRHLEEGYFGNDPYAKEELVAELGAAFLSAKCGLDSKKAFKNSVAYLQSWGRRFREDKKLFVWAAGRAEKAAKFILTGQKPKSEE